MKGNGMGKDVFDIFTGKRGYLTICLFSLFLSLLNLNEPRFLFSDETDELTCDFLLEKYSDYLEWFNDFSVTIESDGRSLIRDWENHTITKTNVTKFQDQWKIEKTTAVEYVGRDSSDNMMDEALYGDHLKINAIKNEKYGESIGIVAERRGDEKDASKELAKMIPSGLFLGYGFLSIYQEDDFESFPDVLRKAISEGAETKITKNEKVVQLSVDSSLFHAELEFIPEWNYAVRKGLFLRLGDAIKEAYVVYETWETEEFAESEGFYAPKISRRYRLSSIETQPFVPYDNGHINRNNETPFGLRKDSYWEDETKETWSDLNKLKSPPKMAMENLFPIPNGTNVAMVDEEGKVVDGADDVWMDGKIVSREEWKMAQKPAERETVQAPRSSWFWILLIGLAAALTVGAMRLYHVWRED